MEIDESKFSKRKFHWRNKVGGVWVIGMVELINQRRVVFEVVEKREWLSLYSLIEKYVVKESIIYTDKWKGHNDLSNIGYQNFCVNHSIEFKISNTNAIEDT